MIQPGQIRRGDRVWSSKDPSGEHEQPGDRSWLVLSHAEQHQALEIVITVPLTSIDRDWETHVRMNPAAQEPEVAMCELVRSMPVRTIRRVDSAPFPGQFVEQAHSILSTLTAPRRWVTPDRGI